MVEQGSTLRQLLRHRLAVLPVARVDPARPVRAQPRRPDERAAQRRVRALARSSDDDTSTVATWLHDAGLPHRAVRQVPQRLPATPSRRTYVPPGWDDWASPTAGNAVRRVQLHAQRERHARRSTASKPRTTSSTCSRRRRSDFIDRRPQASKPFFLYVAPYVPHQPATPAPRYANAFPGAQAAAHAVVQPGRRQRRAAVGARPPPLDAGQIQGDRPALPHAASSRMLGVEDMLRDDRRHAAATGQLDNTYIVFTSDNGFHLGQHRLPPGKQTPYETDIHVPLVVRGPGVAPGTHVDRVRRRDRSRADVRGAGRRARRRLRRRRFVRPTLHGQSDPAAPEDALIEHYSARRFARRTRRGRQRETHGDRPRRRLSIRRPRARRRPGPTSR